MKKNSFASRWIQTSKPCCVLTRMRAKLSFTIAILLRQFMMELLNCCLLCLLDSLSTNEYVAQFSHKTS